MIFTYSALKEYVREDFERFSKWALIQSESFLLSWMGTDTAKGFAERKISAFMFFWETITLKKLKCQYDKREVGTVGE